MQNISLSVTHSDNKINVKHNNRNFEEREWGHTTNSHINRDLTKYTTSFIQQDIKEAYQEAFGEALAEYNEKQKRKYLKIPDYYDYIKGLNDQHKTKAKGGKATTKYNLQDEIIITIGNKDYWDDLHSRVIGFINDKTEAERIFIEYKKKQSDEIFKAFLKDFQSKHKHLHVFNAVAHYDEAGAPHMHLTFFGKAEGMKKGLRLQPRTTRAVAQDLDGDFYQKMLESDQKKYDLAKENRERKKQGLKPLQGDRKGDMAASADVYKQFLAETKQILIEKAQELGLEYQAVGTHNYGEDMDHFKETMKKRKEAIDKEVGKYEQEKQAEINKLDEEISNKKAQAQEADKTAQQAQETAKQAQKDAEKARQAKDEASREERIARQNAELAQAQAESFRKELERLKSEKKAQAAELSEQKQELAELTEKVIDQNLELEEAKEQQAQELAQHKQELETQKNALKQKVEENLSKINEQKQEISENEATIAQHNEQISFVTKRDNALYRLEQDLNKMNAPIDYEKEIGVSKLFPGKIVMGQKTYERMREKASFFSTFGDLRDVLVSAIKESPIVKRLQEQVEHWKAKFFNLEKDFNEMKKDLDEDIYNLQGEVKYLNTELEEHRLFEHQFRKYLSESEQDRILEKIRTREAKDIEENGIEKARARDDDFSR